jgi:glutathionyl-hydroquinone reductase
MWTTKLMVDGIWRGDMVETPEVAARRRAHRDDFSARVQADPQAEFPAERGRYHLYVSYACPFAHRVILGRVLKKLEDVIGLSVLHPRWNTREGWVFAETAMSSPDRAGNGFTHLHQAYATARPDFTGRVTVPVLWDMHTRRIVSDDSSTILDMLDTAFDHLGGDTAVRLRPPALAEAIDDFDRTTASAIAGGVYDVGGADDQAAYDAAEERLSTALDRAEARLADGRSFIHGPRLTRSDILLFTPLVRFDLVYHPLFRAFRRRIADYPALSNWLQRMLAVPGIAATVRPAHILAHYYDGWAPRNPRIVPVMPAGMRNAGPASSWTVPE